MDPFDLAFGEAVSGLVVEKTAEELAAEALTTDPPAKTAEELAAEAAAAEPAAKTAEELAAEAAAAEPAAKTTEELAAEALTAENARLKADLQARTTEPTAEQKAAAEAAKTEREKAEKEWKDFEKDWAEPAAMMLKMHSSLVTQFQSMLQQAIAPLMAANTQTAEEKFKSAVEEKHSDGFELIRTGAVDKWIDTLPSYQKAGAAKILESGTPKEVIELLDAYRAVNPAVVKVEPPAETPEQAAARVQQEQEKSRKLVSLALVPDKRTAVPNGASDPNDFDGAFSQAIASGN